MIRTALNNAKELFPICIPSYNRASLKENKTMSKLIMECDDEIKKNTYLFVRKEQEDDYKKVFENECNIITIPQVNGLASTRQYICDFALEELNAPYIIDMDDDITSLRYIYKDENGKIKCNSKEEDRKEDIFRLICEISKVAFEIDGCILGAIRREHFCNNEGSYNIAYNKNGGPTPRQVTVVNVKELQNRGIRRNPAFDVNGDDVGFVAEITKRFGDMFNIPCMAYSFVDDAVNSVIRNDSNRRQKSEHTYNELLKYPMRKYLRIPFTYDDGMFKFGDIDYKKYNKLTNKAQKKVSLESFCRGKEWK